MMHRTKFLIVSMSLLLTGCNATGQYRRTDIYNRAVLAGGEFVLGPYSNLNLDCSLIGHPQIKIVQAPKSGTVTTVRRNGFPNNPSSHSRAHCNTRRVPVLDIVYRAKSNTSGTDQVIFEVIWPNGTFDSNTLNVSIR
jgi:hypothetical protein